MSTYVIKDIEKVNRERVERLCVALESGQFTQTNSALRDHKGNCCLGVACTLVDPDRWIEILDTWYYMYPHVDLDDYDVEGRDEDDKFVPSSTEYPPQDIIDWYGFGIENPEVYVTCDEIDGGTERCVNGTECEKCHGAANEDGITSLVALNDEFYWSFTEIAAAIRKTYLS